MKFERESWRKLYIAESIEHRLLPLFTRGLRDYLLRLASDDGTILATTDDPKGDLVRALRCDKKETKAASSAIEDLLRIGYLSHEDRRLWISKFEEAQQSRSPEARRQAAWREAHGKGSKTPSNKTDFGSIRRLRVLDGDLCSYCETKLDFRLGRSQSTATLDHVSPRQLGGGDEEDNLVLACWSCNSRKGSRTPEQAGMALLNARVAALRTSVTNNAAGNVGIDETRSDETRSPKPPAAAQTLPARAAAILANPYDGEWERPSSWPEVLAVCPALSFGMILKLRDNPRTDSDLRAILEAFRDGYTVEELVEAGKLALADEYFQNLKKPGPSAFTAAVLRRLLADRAASPKPSMQLPKGVKFGTEGLS